VDLVPHLYVKEEKHTEEEDAEDDGGEGVKSFRGRDSCHRDLSLHPSPLVAAVTRPATAICACHSTCHRYMRLSLDLPPLYSPVTRPATAIFACHSTCHRYICLSPDLPPLYSPVSRPVTAISSVCLSVCPFVFYFNLFGVFLFVCFNFFSSVHSLYQSLASVVCFSVQKS